MQTTEMNFMSFFKTSDVYDPDRIASDLELIRRFYLKNGYADFRVIGSDAQFSPELGGYVITITVEEGPQYTVASVDVESHLPALDAASLRPFLRLSAGQIYNGDLVEKTTDALTKEVTTHGYAFSQVRPRGDRDPTTRTVAIVFVVEEGPRVYIERIVIRGNTRTRDYVIRREFEIGEGDAYNRVLIERAERRLNNLGYFKKVKITNEQGSAPDRIIVVVDVEDQPTGSLSLSGGYSTSNGFIAEVAVSESNFMGRGQYVRLSVSEGQYARGVEFSFTEPYLLGNRIAAGFDVYAKQQSVSPYSFYNNFVTGGTLRFGLPVTDEITFSPRYSLYNTNISIPNNSTYPYNDCNSPIWGTTPGFNGTDVAWGNSCLTNGEASLALKQAVGNTLTSMFGYTLSYNSLDNNKNPTSPASWPNCGKTSLAPAASRSSSAPPAISATIMTSLTSCRRRSSAGRRNLGLGRRQSVSASSTTSTSDPAWCAASRPTASARATYRAASITTASLTTRATPLAAPLISAPAPRCNSRFRMCRGISGLRARFSPTAALCSTITGQTNFSPITAFARRITSRRSIRRAIASPWAATRLTIRSSVGASLIWSSPLGPIRFDFAKAITKSNSDQTQFFRFTGGTTF